jgi:hypothetical protein
MARQNAFDRTGRLAIVLGTVLATGCGGEDAPAEGPGAYAADFADSDEFFTLMAGPRDGQSPHGRVQIWYSANAVDRLGSASVPVGTVAIKTGDPEADGTIDYHVVMVKRAAGYDPAHNDWMYEMRAPTGDLLVDDDGDPVQGALELCWSCHAAAAATDYLAGTQLR